jgi:acetyltransferase-like isoleucine patch superfamily enzyme
MRDSLKAVARALAFLVILPQILSFSIRASIMGRDRALEGSTQWLALMPGLLGVYLRKAFLSYALAYAAPSATVSFGTIFSRAGARLDTNVYVGPGCVLGLVHIERDVLIGSGVQITSGRQTHGTDDPLVPIREQEGAPVLVRVGQGSWIGSGAIVMADVGANAVVGAGSVVTKPVPDSVVAAGVPAAVIRQRA